MKQLQQDLYFLQDFKKELEEKYRMEIIAEISSLPF
jgi:hypothetical protein